MSRKVSRVPVGDNQLGVNVQSRQVRYIKVSNDLRHDGWMVGCVLAGLRDAD